MSAVVSYRGIEDEGCEVDLVDTRKLWVPRCLCSAKLCCDGDYPIGKLCLRALAIVVQVFTLRL